jgi:tetratricopeptide (TPR) repeat protein
VFLVLNDLDRAEQLYTDALTATETSREELVAAHCMANLGMIAFRRFALDEAIERTQNALSRYRRIGDRTRIQEVILNLGFFHHLRGEHQQGKDMLETVLADAHGDWILTTLSEEQLADVARVEGDEGRAQAYLAHAAEMCARVGVTRRQAVFLGLLAESLWASGDVAGAIAALERSAQADEALTLSHALLQIHLGPVSHAEAGLDRFIPIEMDPHRRYFAQLGRARTWAWTERRSDALRLCDELLAEMAATKVARFYLPVRCLRNALAGDLEAAIDALEQMRGVSSPAERAEATLDVGTLLLLTHEAPPATSERFVALGDDASPPRHLGLQHRLDDVHAEIHGRLGNLDLSASLRERARVGFEELLARLDSPDRERLLQHPWLVWMRGLRSAAPPTQ